jgi:hypothetical protein
VKPTGSVRADFCRGRQLAFALNIVGRDEILSTHDGRSAIHPNAVERGRITRAIIPPEPYVASRKLSCEVSSFEGTRLGPPLAGTRVDNRSVYTNGVRATYGIRVKLRIQSVRDCEMAPE